MHSSLGVIDGRCPDVVAVFAADHVYRMDIRQMADFHMARDADVTVAGIPVPVREASSFGVMATDAEARIQLFQEKSLRPQTIPGDPKRAYASMGNYKFKPQVLEKLLHKAALCGDTDFGSHIIPDLPSSGLNVLAYDFAGNELSGIKPHEERAYWRDLGSLGALARARADVVGDAPRFDLRNAEWPIRRDLWATLPPAPPPAARASRSGQGWPVEAPCAALP